MRPEAISQRVPCVNLAGMNVNRMPSLSECIETAADESSGRPFRIVREIKEEESRRHDDDDEDAQDADDGNY
jgi:hypothetical protein